MANDKYFSQIRIETGDSSVNEVDIRDRLGDATIYQVGIQGPYGSKFKLNGVDAIIGPSEVFEFSNIIPIDELIVYKPTMGRVIVDVLHA